METTDDEKRSEIKILKELKKAQTKKLKQKLKQKSNLSAVNDALLEKLHRLELQLQESKDAYLGSSNHALVDTQKAAQKLDLLDENVQTSLEVHSPHGSSDQGMTAFPSRISAEKYFQAEEEFTASLTGFTKRQFFEGIADMAGSKDKLRYEILEVSKPEELLIRGESEDVLQSKCKELQRLQSVYANSQSEKFQSHCNLHRVHACLYKTEENISRLPSDSEPFDAELLSSRISDLQRSCEEKSRQLQRIFEDQLGPLIEEMSELQTAKILSGNFDLKIARQDYFISKQEEVIDQLLLQNSRYEFLSILYEMEAKSHRDMHHLLSSAKSILAGDETALKKRLEAIGEHLHEKQPRETIDSRDHFMQNLFKIFDTDEPDVEKRPFITYDMLQNNFQAFLRKSKSNVDRTDPDEGEFVSTLDKIKKELDKCSAIILGKDDKNSDESKEDVSDSILKIEDVLTTIEKSVKSAISEIDKKKKILASDSIKAMERTLFTNFFNDPARMKRMVTELKTRVEAMTN